MKKLLKNFIPEKIIADVWGKLDQEIDDIEVNSKKITQQNTLFIALQGVFVNGEDFIGEAIENGVKAILVSENFDITQYKRENITFVKVFDIKNNFWKIVSNFFDNPTEKLKVIAVTGTCGKTSVASLGQQLFNFLGRKSGLISTIHIDDGNKIIPSKMTTPGVLDLQRHFYDMVQNNVEFCFIEASSHALDQGRLNGTKIYGAIFTNVSNNEHLDYHKTFQNYIEAKKTLFTHLERDSFAIFNVDDEYGNFMMKDSVANKFSFGLDNKSDFSCLFENDVDGLKISFDKKKFIPTKLLGKSNVYNLLAVYAAAKISQIATEVEVEGAIKKLEPVIGRFQIFRYKGINVVVDYAHKPQALKTILENIRSFCKRKIITVFGCGGERDTSKRSIMTETACALSDEVIITSDNTRHENFKNIVSDMVKTLSEDDFRKVSVVFSRKSSINFAISIANEGDFVAILGKGHENYQIIGDKVFNFSDIEFIENLVKNV